MLWNPSYSGTHMPIKASGLFLHSLDKFSLDGICQWQMDMPHILSPMETKLQNQQKKLFLIKIQCSKLSSYTQSINQLIKKDFLQHHRLQANNKLTNRGPRSYAPCVKKLGNKNELWNVHVYIMATEPWKWVFNCVLNQFQYLTSSSPVINLPNAQISWNFINELCTILLTIRKTTIGQNSATKKHTDNRQTQCKTLPLPTYGRRNSLYKPQNIPRDRETSSLRWSRRCSVMAVRAFNSLPKLVQILAQVSGIRAQVYAKFFVSSLAAGSANSATSCLSFSAQISSSCMHCLPRRPLFKYGRSACTDESFHNLYCFFFRTLLIFIL